METMAATRPATDRRPVLALAVAVLVAGAGCPEPETGSGADAGTDAGVAPADASADTHAHLDASAPLDADTSPDVASPDTPARTLDADAGPVYPPPPEVIGGDRPAQVFVPGDYDAAHAWPLIVLLHGYTINAFLIDAYIQLSARTTSRGFLLVTPDGTTDPDGDPYWNATEGCCDFFDEGVDDVAYLRGLVTEASAKMHVDPARVFFVGHSNGGFMSHRMACDAADTVRGIVSLAGANHADASLCQPTQPVRVLQVHGTDDETISDLGGLFDGAYPSAEASVATWRARNACADTEVAGGPFDYDDDVAGDETTTRAWTDCAPGGDVALWKMAGSTHVPIFTDAFREAILDFLLGPVAGR